MAELQYSLEDPDTHPDDLEWMAQRVEDITYELEMYQ